VLQCVAVCCSVFCGLDSERNEEQDAGCFTWSNAVMCCSVLQCVAVCYNVLQCVLCLHKFCSTFTLQYSKHAASCCMVALVGVRAGRIERWGAGVETQKNVRGEIGGWGRVPFNETYAPSLSTIYDGA